MGAIASLVDEIGASVVYEKDVPMNVSIDMSISYLSTAKLNVSSCHCSLIMQIDYFNLKQSENQNYSQFIISLKLIYYNCKTQLSA